MPVPYSSRELSERVEIDFQRRPNRFRRRVWWSALWVSLLCLGWLAYAGSRGEHRIFEGGDLASPHRIFENDCAKCHTTWAPVDRFVSFDVTGDKVSSVTNQACLACHPGAVHHEKQIPKHDNISCAHCHVEHVGEHDLKRVVNQACVDCHRDLKTSDGSATHFAAAVHDFDQKDGHPEFAFEKLLKSKEPQVAGIGAEHQVLKTMAFSPERGWHDKAQMRFNHAAHVKMAVEGNGFIVAGADRVMDPAAKARFGPFPDSSGTCKACHEEEADGRFMKPISFDAHCKNCHPLLFDNRQYPKETVPHGVSMEAVRGFLTDRYTLAALSNPDSVQSPQPERLIPGRKTRPALSRDQAGWVAEQVKLAEQNALRHTHVFFGAEAKGGCAYCHSVKDSDTDKPQIVKPGIPSRWQAHARFAHHSHQLLNCSECHGDVLKSKDTGDVLLPGIDVCRKCHASDPVQPGADHPVRYFGARTDCVECHIYHDHSKDSFVGRLNPVLEASSVTPGSASPAVDSKK